MLRRGLWLAAVLLVFAAPVRAGTVGLAEVRGADGTLIGKAAVGAYAYPTDGSILRIGSSRVTATRVELRNVSMFNGRITVRRIIVPSRGLAGARIDGLVVDGTGFVVGPNAIIPLDGGSYVVALQEAVSPGRTGSGLVALRAFFSDPSLGLAPGLSSSSASPAPRTPIPGRVRRPRCSGCHNFRLRRPHSRACRCSSNPAP